MRSNRSGEVAGWLGGRERVTSGRLRPSYPATRLPSYRDEQGLSLIEATIILGVISMLTAVLAPSVRVYVQGAQQAAAKQDVEAIGSALSRMLTDVGELWVSRDGTNGSLTAAPSHAVTNRVDLLVSEGKTPAVYTARSVAGDEVVDWGTAVNNTFVQKLEYFLATNTPGGVTDGTTSYRTAVNTSVAGQFDPDDGGTFNAEHAWRGAYLAGPIGPDPWGYRYAANVEFLGRALGVGPSGNVNDVIVLSAGSNGLIETRYDTDGPASGNDVFYVFSGGTR